ncbi:MAG: type II toxin-antitoxin system VapC family toxin [Burkholderiales bacterium]
MAFVVDCSVAARWYLPDEATAYTDRILERLRVEPAHVPALWISEFANVFLKLERQRKLARGLTKTIFQEARNLMLVADRQPVDPEALYNLAGKHGLSVYDATYLELALRLKTPLATSDGGLARVARRVNLFFNP